MKGLSAGSFALIGDGDGHWLIKDPYDSMIPFSANDVAALKQRLKLQWPRSLRDDNLSNDVLPKVVDTPNRALFKRSGEQVLLSETQQFAPPAKCSFKGSSLW